MDVVIPFLLFSLFVIGVGTLLLWWLVPVAFPALGFGFWNAAALSALIYIGGALAKGLLSL